MVSRAGARCALERIEDLAGRAGFGPHVPGDLPCDSLVERPFAQRVCPQTTCVERLAFGNTLRFLT